MIAPALPFNEAARLHTLRSLSLLDSSAEERFDRLTRLAQRLFEVPIALVSLVDENRQWFKSKQGLALSETPRDQSFCAHAILGDAIMVVADTWLDERFAGNPLVLDEPKIRFYAGCPLKATNGSKLGTLCLLDVRPRTLDAAQCESLRDLARLVSQEIAVAQLTTIDGLTMLCNRRGFTALGQHVLSLCTRRMERPASLLLLNLDGFKRINQRWGQAEGDRALVSFAGLLSQTFRESDVIGRLGSDDFAVLIADCADVDGKAALQRLQARADAFNADSGRGYEIHFSVGAVDFEPIRHSSIAALLADAEARMHEHKRFKQAA